MEKLVKKLHSLRQELVISQRYNYVATRSNVKTFDKCIIELDKLLDEFESELSPSLINNELQHYKDATVGLYATDKEPESIFEEVFVHLIEKTGMDGEKTFSPMDYEYYNEYFKKGIKLLMWRLS